MHRTNIYLDDEQCAALDEVAGAQGRSRSELIREMVARGLGESTGGLDEDLAAIEQSFAIMDEIEVSDRGEDGRARHLDQVWRGTR